MQAPERLYIGGLARGFGKALPYKGGYIAGRIAGRIGCFPLEKAPYPRTPLPPAQMRMRGEVRMILIFFFFFV